MQDLRGWESGCETLKDLQYVPKKVHTALRKDEGQSDSRGVFNERVDSGNEADRAVCIRPQERAKGNVR